MAGFKIHFILNNVKNNLEISIGLSVKSVSMKYLGINTQYVGYIEYDDCIRNCINNRMPFMRSYASSRCAKEIEKITDNLMNGKQFGVTRFTS
jgi:flagellar biosynthesis protein FlhG